MTQELSTRKNTAAPTGGGVTDHGLLTGLPNDDHPQYSRVDGFRAFTATVSGVLPTVAAHLATKGYADTTFAPIGDGGAAAVATHVALADPHTQYQKESEKAAANGYASLDAGVRVPRTQLPLVATGKYATTSFTVDNGEYAIVSRHVTLVSTDRATLAGTATLRIT